MRWLIVIWCSVCAAGLLAQSGGMLRSQRSVVSFVSDAPMERISAQLTSAKGIVDPIERTFVVQIPMTDFEGFNSPLQREHFRENYLETERYPTAVFKGRIIESVDITVPGSYAVRAKGAFMLHGVERERIIECLVVVAKEGVRVTSGFEVLLEDHAIRVPRVVQQKIAPEVRIEVDMLFERMAAAP
ncbi:MAG: YceI family protein [Flavobacteriales bacterium]|nr:YceI family protein [Flavobacteriales bacterium]